MVDNTDKIDTKLLPTIQSTTILLLITIVAAIACFIPYVGFFALLVYAFSTCQYILIVNTNNAINAIKTDKEVPKFESELVRMFIFCIFAVLALLFRLGIEAIGGVMTMGIGFVISLLGFGINVGMYLYFYSEAKKKYDRNVSILTSNVQHGKAQAKQPSGDPVGSTPTLRSHPPKPKFCEKCGFELAITAKFCRRCGSSVGG